MKFTLVALILFYGKISCLEGEEDRVLVLDDSNFDKEIKNHDYLLIHFSAFWSGQSQTLAPEYAKAAEILRNENPPIYLARVDATENSMLAHRFSIEEFPTFKFYSMGEFKDYDGGRTHEEIVTWIKKKTGPPSMQVATVGDVEDLKLRNEVVCVYFGSEESNEQKFFENVAEKFNDVTFAHTSSNQLANHYGAKLGNILLFKKFDEEKNKYEAEITEESLEQFLKHYSIPLVSTYNDKMAEAIFGKNQKGFFFVRSSKSAEQLKLEPIIKNIAHKYRGKLFFVMSDIVGENEEKLAEYLGASEEDLPLIRIMDVQGEEDVKTYAMLTEITESGVDQFVQNFLDGRLVPYLKSEEIPTVQTGPVIKVVAKNFNEVVLNSDKHIFIIFYETSCPNYKEIYPTFENLASTFRNDPNIIFAKLDLKANEIEDVVINGYPLLKFYLAHDKSNPINYIGLKIYEYLLQFVNELLYPEKFRKQAHQKDQKETKVDL